MATKNKKDSKVPKSKGKDDDRAASPVSVQSAHEMEEDEGKSLVCLVVFWSKFDSVSRQRLHWREESRNRSRGS
jgi:hypothetical protein